MNARHRTVSLLATAAAGAAVIVGAVPSPALAANPATRLTLTYATGEVAAPASERATLRCEPFGGTHRRAIAACAALRKVNGDFTALKVSSAACTLQYTPVTVTASGTWKGRTVRYQRTFGNGCALRTDTGPVFRFR